MCTTQRNPCWILEKTTIVTLTKRTWTTILRSSSFCGWVCVQIARWARELIRCVCRVKYFDSVLLDMSWGVETFEKSCHNRAGDPLVFPYQVFYCTLHLWRKARRSWSLVDLTISKSLTRNEILKSFLLVWSQHTSVQLYQLPTALVHSWRLFCFPFLVLCDTYHACYLLWRLTRVWHNRPTDERPTSRNTLLSAEQNSLLNFKNRDVKTNLPSTRSLWSTRNNTTGWSTPQPTAQLLQ